MSKTLVLRENPEYRNPEDSAWESSVQNALADAGYPVARVYFVCGDKTLIGGAFFIMDFMPGKPMLTALEKNWPEMLRITHAALHRIDPEPLIKSLNEQGFAENRYRVLRCLEDLYGGLWNQELHHPFIVSDSIEVIHKVTGVQITMPD
jgi:aminoglycoside phosphotransferase (APT) family kinase protein